jgi:hypothetical protein
MNSTTYAARRWSVISKSFLLVLVISWLFIPNHAWSLTLGANNGWISFSVKPAGGASAMPVFGPGGELLSPGGGYPLLGPALVPVQTFGPAGIAPLGLSGVANPALIDAGAFGAGATTLQAFGAPWGGAISWSSAFVMDFAANASVSANDSQGIANFINNGPGAFSGWGGGILAVNGSIGLAGGYVAASLTGTIGGIPFTPIVVASDGAGPLLDFVSAGMAQAFLPTGPNSFFAWGVSIIPGLFNIPLGGNITLQGTLSLIADPMSYIQLDILPPGTPKPDFGVAGNVPVPGTLLLLASGLAALAGLSKRVGRRDKL